MCAAVDAHSSIKNIQRKTLKTLSGRKKKHFTGHVQSELHLKKCFLALYHAKQKPLQQFGAEILPSSPSLSSSEIDQKTMALCSVVR